jgi:hypothetical protein
MQMGASGKTLGSFCLKDANGLYSKEINLDDLVKLYQLDEGWTKDMNGASAKMRVSAGSGTFEYNQFSVDLWRHLAGEPKERVVSLRPNDEEKLDERDPLLEVFAQRARKIPGAL